LSTARKEASRFLESGAEKTPAAQMNSDLYQPVRKNQKHFFGGE
jgi:hypothetical protein